MISMSSASTYVPNIDDVHADASASNRDPFKFSHGLTGVDQPANYLFVNILVATALILVILAISFRLLIGVRNYERRISVINACRKQDFWKKDRHPWWGLLKRYFLYAPVLANQHDREIRISKTINVGTLPTRPQLAVIIFYVVSNVVYCAAIPMRPRAQMLAEFRGRCGTLAAFNMIFIVLFALRNNPFIRMLHISYDTFNLFHRWVARLGALESIAHVFAFMFNAYHVSYEGRGGWHSVNWIIHHSLSYRWGFAALFTMSLLVLHSISPLRHAFYESFLTLHRIGIFIVMAGIYFHLVKHALPQLPWVYLFIAFLALEYFARLFRILNLNIFWKRGTWTQVSLEALPGEATRATFLLPRSWNANPGSHVHIYLPRVALWSSHPFSVAWFSYAKPSSEKLPLSIDGVPVEEGTGTISCVIRARTGMTRSLYELASTGKVCHVKLWGAIEGPYGSYHSLDSYGTAVLFAVGVGITHQLSFVRHLLAGHNSNTVGTEKILFIWCITDTECLEWIQPWLEELTAMKNFREVIRIRIHISKMAAYEIDETQLPEFLDIRTRRCNPQEVVDEEILAQVGAMVVSVCGPGGFSDSVRAAVRRRVCIRSIDLIEETFSY
ncbi:ferric reductase [Cucurbitaria berberidis CBS 394.84]|uniref:Ferric reductase n=1 Tax=Cucurbitaria berberidis CBS 394.84 TaxID=1168544 RepID=A0A9P4LDT2_9PLEO|nr:ferric reductase [Cucurbitaria berberidis CBS 394.84]KAF1850702.1 ferric reductase [Cucurbitaria berberidis CBS 394.84]